MNARRARRRRDAISYYEDMFSEWCSLQLRSFTGIKAAVSRDLRKRTNARDHTGVFGVRFGYYASGELRPRARRAFDIGQAIGNHTIKSEGYASGPIALLAAGHLPEAISLLGDLAMTDLDEPPGDPGEAHNRVLLAMRFADCTFEELTSYHARRLPRGVPKSDDMIRPGASRRRIGSIYTDFLFGKPDETKRYLWALDVFKTIGCKSKTPHRRHEGHVLYKYFVVAAESGSAIWHYADTAAAAVWDSLRAPWLAYTWAMLSKAYHKNSDFHEYVDRRYQNQFQALFRFETGRQPRELDSARGPGEVRH